MKHSLYFSILLTCFSAILHQQVKACHGISLSSITVTSSPTDVTINANSDPATCGCGPYYMEVEAVPITSIFSGTPPVYNSGAWGTAPWYHSILNVPGYGPPLWTDNCVIEPYTPLVIPFSGLCPGTTYKFRIREIAVLGTPSAWSAVFTFTTSGSPLSPVLNPSASPIGVCLGDSTFLDAFGGGCSGPGTFTWAPAASLTNPNASSTIATPSVTTTYTITFFDQTLNQTFTDSITVVVVASLSITSSIIEASCLGNDGSITVNTFGGFSPYSYLWVISSDTTNFQNNLSSTSSYDLIITDMIGCTDTFQLSILDSCDLVWPGDANDDGVADNFDILDIGIGFGTTGTTRLNSSIAWIGIPSANWIDTLVSGTNYKHIDCNGDGIIDLDDTLAVIQNYSLTRPPSRYEQSDPIATAPDLTIDISADSVASGGFIAVGQINLGTLSQNAVDIYGIAFTLNFDTAQINIQTASIYPVSSWMGNPSVDLFGVNYRDLNNGQIDFAMSRTDQVSNTGAGTIAAFSFHTTSMLVGSNNAVMVPFTISNVRVISANQNPVVVNTISDSVLVYDDQIISSENNSTMVSDLSIYPNPITEQFTLRFVSQEKTDYTIRISNSLGEIIYTESITNQTGIISRNIQMNAPAGIYFIEIINSNGQTVRKLIKQ
jgi:Secretion system C-terminal sorting domain/SprB repeat